MPKKRIADMSLGEKADAAFLQGMRKVITRAKDTGTPVSEDYQVPFKFTGELETVTIDLR